MMHDPTILNPADLEAHVEWLRRLALALVGDRDDADEIAQETLLRALVHRPDAERPLRAWLTVVARNLARMRRRRRLVRSGDRRVTEGDALAPPAVDVVARTESLRRLVDVLLELEEPLRTTVLLRYSEGLSGAEIARRTGVPEGTVRWRLKRGMDTLRDRLDESGDRGRSAMGALLVPASRAGHAVAAAPALTAGAILMTWKGMVAAGAACALVFAAVWLGSASPPSSTEATRIAGSAPADAPPPWVGGEPTEDRDAPATAGVPVAREEQQPEDSAVAKKDATRIRVVDTDGGPVPGATVTLLDPDQGIDLQITAVSVTSDGDGEAVLPAPLERGIWVLADKEGYAPAVAGVLPDADPVVTLRAAGTLFGRVLEYESRAPIASARLTFGDGGLLPQGGPLETSTAADGSYRFERAARGEEFVICLLRDGYSPFHSKVRLEPEGDTRFDLLVPRGASLIGVAIDAETGAPVPGVEVNWGPTTKTDENGRFEAHGLVAEVCFFELRIPGYCMTQRMPQREALDEGKVFVFPMFRACSLDGIVRDETGQPVEGALVWVSEANGDGDDPIRESFPRTDWTGMRIHFGPGDRTPRTDRRGRFHIAGLKPYSRPIQVEVSTPTGDRRVLSAPITFSRPGEACEIELCLRAGGVLEGIVHGATYGLAIRWTGPTMSAVIRLEEPGYYRIGFVEPGVIRVEVGPETTPLQTASLVVEAGKTTRWDCFVEEVDKISVAGVVRRPDGDPVPGVLILAGLLGQKVKSPVQTDASGRFRLVCDGEPGEEIRLEYDWSLTSGVSHSSKGLSRNTVGRASVIGAEDQR